MTAIEKEVTAAALAEYAKNHGGIKMMQIAEPRIGVRAAAVAAAGLAAMFHSIINDPCGTVRI